MFSELCRCFLQQWSLPTSFWTATYSLGSSLDCLEVMMGLLWSVICNPFPVLEVSFDNKMSSLNSISPLFLVCLTLGKQMKMVFLFMSVF